MTIFEGSKMGTFIKQDLRVLPELGKTNPSPMLSSSMDLHEQQR